MAATARLVVGVSEVRAFVPYELREIPKTFPGRRWDSVGKCWRVGREHLDALADALRAAGCTVYVVGAPDPRNGQGQHGERSTPGADWADRLLDAVGPQRAERAYKALVKVLHPDAGGDNRLMQELNDAWGRRQGGADQ